MDRYPIARERIVKHFGSINKFCGKTGIPKVSAIRVLQGKYGSGDTDDSRQRDRIEAAMLGQGVPREDLRNMWARIQQEAATKIISMNGRKFKMSLVVILEELGDAVSK